jgi:hypothetical protein
MSPLALPKSMLALAAAAGLISCATPANVSVAQRVTLEGAKADFRDCGVSVVFSGTPRALYPNEAATYTRPLGRSGRWQVDGLAYQEFRLVQTALCLCRDTEFSNEDMARTESRMANNSNRTLMPMDSLSFARKVIGFDSPYARGSITEQARLLFPHKARSCFFVQGGKFLPTAPDALKDFFATLQPLAE